MYNFLYDAQNKDDAWRDCISFFAACLFLKYRWKTRSRRERQKVRETWQI